ncbi:related to nasopharyngeal carcinoma susceptibility protein LZ16 [Fusarium torulosum]|uniref:Related to nasopharyngeal carcinoma susceptibility protein LZ16 n=1 Tax=Fusarium torulosum TaxID=33205 RepID=A0AAE8MD82_9HYPO|nr:related to nasopharyngeal carcinoma susceptibility protein LZ16 [Fusarium torulosum]
MDAQNAAQSDQTRPAGDSLQRPDSKPELSKSTPPPVSPKPSEPLDKDKNKDKDVRRNPNSSSALDQDASEGRDSDAETIVLPGKDGHSPSKARKVRQEDRSDGDGDAEVDNDGDDGPKSSIKAAGYRPPEFEKQASSIHARGDPIKKKRISAHLDRERLSRGKDAAASSGLSSAPTSPPHHRQQHRRRFADDTHSSSDSEHSHPRTIKPLREKLKSSENTVLHKRKSLKVESDDEGEGRKVRRQRTTSASIDSTRLQRENKPLSATSHYDSQNRSISPQSRSHRRSASSQLPSYSSNGLGLKKRRLPPPLHSTDYHSDDSSASGSPHPRSSKLRSLATPAADTNASPARMAPHKKHLDAHGQTFLARACARGEYEGAKTRLTERPEDLNVADYAGNTPLQIAAINGCEDIVKLLIDAGCNLDCVNYDKDTPLLDAVDNGHLGVVKLLLDAGVNPRKANVNGEEPVDRVSDDTDNAEEIRAALLAARKRAGDRRRTSEEHHSHQDQDPRDSHAPDSPRRSPTTNSGSGRRTGTVRATKTRNDLLYMPLDEKTLRQAAGRGDEETVARILQVKEGYNDPESMVAAARGGHDLVIQLLLGLGGANPDPRPIVSTQPEFATPILAAIGQENIKVVELLLEQAGFDPTRRYRGETYYEIARHRAGPNWKDEEHMLKNAYDEYKRSHKDSAKTKSPNRRERDQERGDREDRETKRPFRTKLKEKDEARQHKRNISSPEPKKKSTTSKLTSPREKRRSGSFTNLNDESIKRGPGRPRKEDRVPSINISDRELSPAMSHKQLKVKHVDSDAAGVSSEGETVKPRRKLVSKGELRGERERQRRTSMASNASSLKDPPTSPHESRHEESGDKHEKHDKHEKNRVEKLSEKYHDRTKAIKRDESRDRLSVSGDGATKRHRASITPDRPSNGDKDDSEVPPKRRRLETEAKEKRPKQPLSSDERPRKSSSLQDPSKLLSKSNHKKHDDDKREKRANSHRADAERASSVEKQIHVKSEETDVEMRDADSIKVVSEPEPQAARAKDLSEAKEAEQEKQRQAEIEEAKKKEELRKKEEARKKEEERKRVEADAAKKREEEEARKKAEEEEKKRQEHAAEKDRIRREQEEREVQRKRKDEEERQQREEEEKQRREAEEKVRREEEEKQRVEAERKKQREEEEEQRQREEEERLRREQLEREAAEEIRRQREEEERKERERRERAHREDQERKRAAREAEQRRLREEQERNRLNKLPPLLRWFDACPNPKLPFLAEKFKRIQGCRYDTIRQEANGTPEGRELWVLNTHAAILLGEKDLELSRYTAWERAPVSQLAKLTLWRVEWPLYSLLGEKVRDLGRQLPGCYGDEDPLKLEFQTKNRLREEAWEKFRNLDMFFVKMSDLMYTVPNIPHLRNIQLSVEYRELLETEAESMRWGAGFQKWKQDPGAARYHGFAPRCKHYLNGALVGEDMPQAAQTSSTPFPERRVPRRGLVQVYPDDPEYTRICMEQGLEHLVNGHLSPPLVNGIHSSPISQKSMASGGPRTNGTIKVLTPGSTTESLTPSVAGQETLTNGINGNTNGDSNH